MSREQKGNTTTSKALKMSLSTLKVFTAGATTNQVTVRLRGLCGGMRAKFHTETDIRRFALCLMMTGLLLLVSCHATPEATTALPPCFTGPPPTGAPRGVVGLNFSRDGRVLASANADFTIKLWDMATGQVFRTFRGHTHILYKAVFSPDEKLLASSSRDFTARIWDVATGRELHTLTGHRCAVKSVAFSPDGETLASVSNDGMVKLWDVKTGKEKRSLVHWKSLDVDVSVYSVVFTSDGKHLFAGNGDGTISAWEVATGREANVWKAQDRNVLTLTLSHDKRLLASGGDADFTTKIWDATTRRELRTIASARTPGLTENVVATAFSPDDTLVAISELGLDPQQERYVYNRTKVWEVATGKNVLTTQGHEADIGAVDFTPDGRLLVSGSVDGMIRFWDLATGREVRSFTNQPERTGR